MKKIHILISFSLLWTFSQPSFSASFDCAEAKTFVETAICDDEKLSNLDEQLSEAYMVSLTNTSDEKKLRKDQKSWLKNVRNKCTDNICLEKSYLSRLLVLNKITDENSAEKTTEKPAEKPLPKEVTEMATRIESCNHWEGEEGYDKERKKEIDKALKKLKCKQLNADAKKLQKKYKNNSAILKAIATE